ncbi:DUF6461 domain-containing protein [Streptosporangium roseum]|uniref:Uncharacterized protein n=1 Tax=Streptosporangium roseum (strain ATCC 12428 / DSM 43021 / JCM 3005 / KCTC 9067 / NCIMB 10171 / NRRL 2505 / NI 9100) TaxID=479432 RepID=D2B596_STRRD|nr:DUF6461 domain-containing protein [Streptosporangium roseum]ACZ87620.1 hypothetical protein Sros_4794 [Streptosporangium roseum DSM 43021]
MIATPGDYAWFSYERFPDLADAYCFTYVRGLTPEQLMARLGGRPEDFTPMTLEELIETSYRHSYNTAFLGATTIGDWVFVVEPNGGLGIDEANIASLSAGTRLVSHFRDVEGIEYFYWSDDGEIRFCFIADEGCSEEVPEEVMESMRRIDADYRHLYPSDGPAFLLAEHLTGITLTPELLEGSTYLCGVIPEPR